MPKSVSEIEAMLRSASNSDSYDEAVETLSEAWLEILTEPRDEPERRKLKQMHRLHVIMLVDEVIMGCRGLKDI